MKRFFIWLTVAILYLLAAASCSSPEQKLAGYWDGYDFNSLDGFSDYNAAEKKFDNYIKLLNKVPHDVAVADMKKFMESAKLNEVAYMTWAGWFPVVLHDSESRQKNDILFDAWLDMMLEENFLNDEYIMDQLIQMKKELNF